MFSVGSYHGSCAFYVGVVGTSPRAAQSTLVGVVMFSKVVISGTIFFYLSELVFFLRMHIAYWLLTDKNMLGSLTMRS